ncbi:MAG TPA: LuxR C-terminal-related transcriptional regulator [Hyphomicrobiales bacterium]|nr:LuxR C-terminal-related transcriptional regulator [Hyphomicrobiales bacterium]
MARGPTADAVFAATLSDLVGDIYDCALDPTRWPEALAAISAFVGGNRVRLFLFNADPAAPGDGDSIGVDRAFNRAFDRDAETLASIKYGFVVAEMDKAVTLAEILGTSGGRDVNGRLPRDNRFWREWMEARGAHDALAVLAFKTAERFGGLAMTRSAPLPPFGPEDKRKMGLVAPHVRRALTISDLIGRRTLAGARFAEIIDALATPIAIVDRTGKIEHMNPAAAKLVETKAIPIRDGLLPAATPDLCDAQGRTVALQDAAGPGLIATLLPLGAAAGARNGSTAVFFHRAGEPAQVPGEAFAKLYGLTGTELRIALLLAEGAGVVQIADRLGSAPDTVRWHLKNLRAKTGRSRVADLARLAREAASPLLAERIDATAGRPRP